MIYLNTNTPKIYNDLADVVRLFFDGAQVRLEDKTSSENKEFVIAHSQYADDNCYNEAYSILRNGHIDNFNYNYKFLKTNDVILNARTAKRSAKLGLYYALKSITGKALPWGALTGIRPVSLYRQLNTYENLSARHQFETVRNNFV